MSHATDPAVTQVVDAAITSRRSIRAFLPNPVAIEDILAILRVSSRAPSGANTQPWRVHVLTGDSRQQLSEKILAAHNDPAVLETHQQEYRYYPSTWVEPYIARRRKVGWDLYALLNLTRENKAGMHAQHGRNYSFFDAPVGLIFTIDRVLERGSWLDYGMFLQNIMIAARGRGLDTCPQAAFTPFHRIISEHLGLPDTQMLVCGISLGYADPSRVENSLETVREPVEAFTTFYK
jgi:nitroreductase